MTSSSKPKDRSSVKFIYLVAKILYIYLDVIANLFRKQKRKTIRGQNVLITGSGHGLGRETALRFAAEGANLILVDINADNNELVKQEILASQPKNSIEVLAYSCDIRREDRVADLAKKVREEIGSVDVLINNAGIVQCLPFLELSPTLVERTFQVNVMSHIWTIKHFLPDMIKNQRGHIVGISSIAGIVGGKFLTDYCASKFAVMGLMDSLDKEIHHQGQNEGVHLTTICPACMSTGMFQTFTSRFNWLLPVLDAKDVSKGVLEAVLLNKTLVVVPPITLFFHRLSSIIPNRVSTLVQEYLDYGVKSHTH